MDVILGILLPYFTIVFFIGAMIHRVNTWRNMAAPKMTLTPAPDPGFPRFVQMVKETVFFKNLYLEDKSFWAMGWIFHACLALIFVGHFRALSSIPDAILGSLGMSAGGMNTMSIVLGGGAGIVILVAVGLLVYRRFTIKRVKEITTGADLFALSLILLIIITGDLMRLTASADLLEQTRTYFLGLVTFQNAPMPASGWFKIHYFLGMTLFSYIPFSKILHLGGIFFTKSLIHKH